MRRSWNSGWLVLRNFFLVWLFSWLFVALVASFCLPSSRTSSWNGTWHSPWGLVSAFSQEPLFIWICACHWIYWGFKTELEFAGLSIVAIYRDCHLLLIHRSYHNVLPSSTTKGYMHDEIVKKVIHFEWRYLTSFIAWITSFVYCKERQSYCRGLRMKNKKTKCVTDTLWLASSRTIVCNSFFAWIVNMGTPLLFDLFSLQT